MKINKFNIWPKINQELLPTEDTTKSIRKSKDESIIKALNKTLKIIEIHKIFIFNINVNIFSIKSGGSLCTVLTNQNKKLEKT